MILCPDCGGGFVEEIDAHRRSNRHHISPSSSGSHVNTSPAPEHSRTRRSRRNSGDPLPFNPVIVLRGEMGSSYELYYDDGSSSGLRPLPESMSEFLMGLGFDRLLDQLAHLEINGIGRFDNPLASKEREVVGWSAMANVRVELREREGGREGERNGGVYW